MSPPHLHLRNLHDPHNRDIVHLAQTADEREGVQMLRLHVCPQNTWRILEIHKPRTTATDNEDTTLARHLKRRCPRQCVSRVRTGAAESPWSSEQTGPWGSASAARWGCRRPSMNCICGTTTVFCTIEPQRAFQQLPRTTRQGMHGGYMSLRRCWDTKSQKIN